MNKKFQKNLHIKNNALTLRKRLKKRQNMNMVAKYIDSFGVNSPLASVLRLFSSLYVLINKALAMVVFLHTYRYEYVFFRKITIWHLCKTNLSVECLSSSFRQAR